MNADNEHATTVQLDKEQSKQEQNRLGERVCMQRSVRLIRLSIRGMSTGNTVMASRPQRQESQFTDGIFVTLEALL